MSAVLRAFLQQRGEVVDALGRIGVHSLDQRPPLGKRLAQQRLGLCEVALAAQQIFQDGYQDRSVKADTNLVIAVRGGF